MAFRRLPTVNGGEAVGTRLYSCTTMAGWLAKPISAQGSTMLGRCDLKRDEPLD